MTDTTQLATLIDALSAKTLDYALLLAAIGTISMAFIELIKGLTSFRRYFHQHELTKWVADPSSRNELILLAAGGEENADVLFDQPTERMLGQIQAAANLALDYPDRYPYVYRFLSQDDLHSRMKLTKDHDGDSQLWATFATRTAQEGFPTGETQQLIAEDKGRAAQQARARLGNLIARRLDMFQNRTQYRWARLNQVASIAMGSTLAAYALGKVYNPESIDDTLMLVLLSFLSGMLSPFAKDVVAALSGLHAKA